MPAKLHAMVVDDNEDYRFLATTELRRIAGSGTFDVHEADDGETALVALDRILRDNAHCLILGDHRMPTMSGADLARKIRQRFPRSQVRFVLCSSGDDRFAEESLEAGADAFLVKPMDARAFRSALGRVVYQWLDRVQPEPPPTP